jgi:hypothetical protein
LLVEVARGNLARAVGASLANPFVFRELDVRRGGPIDPGLDRVAAVPIEQACSSFPHTAILALNVSGQAPFVSARMRCPAFEVRIDVPAIEAERALGDEAVFRRLVDGGRAAMHAWLSGPRGQRFLARALRRA